MDEPTRIALIPARAGSRRIPGKNVRPLAGHPLLAYAIAAARESGLFSAVVVSTDSEEYAEVARRYGAEVPFLRPPEMSGEESADIEWVAFTLERLRAAGRAFDLFAILRPTSPFRTGATIRRAWEIFGREAGADSLRAVEPCRQHPGKMWVVRGRRMAPLLPFGSPGTPWHSRPFQALPPIHIQNASLEMAWTRVVFEERSISGNVVVPFFTEGHEGFDLNHPDDWERAEELVLRGARLPDVKN